MKRLLVTIILSIIFIIFLSSQALAYPYPIRPYYGEKLKSWTPSFFWGEEKIDGGNTVDYYQLEVATIPAIDPAPYKYNAFYDKNLALRQYKNTLSSEMDYKKGEYLYTGTYYWHVIAFYKDGTYSWSPVFSFTVPKLEVRLIKVKKKIKNTKRGTSAIFTGFLFDQYGLPRKDTKVKIQKLVRKNKWKNVASGKTKKDGDFSIRTNIKKIKNTKKLSKKQKTAYYRIVYSGNPYLSSTSSKTIKILLK